MKIKKIISILVICAIAAVPFTVSVSAAILEIDTGSSMFKVENWWQNNEDNDEVCPLTKVFDVTGMPPGGTPNSEVSRFSTSLNVNEGNMEGSGPLFDSEGRAYVNVIFPFKETVNLESVTWKWNNGTRQYFFFVYASADGENWTEVELTNAGRVTAAATFDDSGSAGGSAIDNIWMSPPSGNGDDGDVLPITFGLSASDPVNYIKFAFYGNDGGQGVEEVTHQWVSFNSFSVTGSIAAAEEPVAPVEESAAAPADIPEPAPGAAAPAPAPVTGDPITLIALGSVISIAGAIIIKRKK